MTTGFHEVRFPDDIAYGATGGPEYATDIVATGSGFEQRNVRWAQARGKWDVASGIKKRAQMEGLIAFFRARKGKAYGFRFKDWTDFKAVSQTIGIGNGSTTFFQLVKLYESGGAIESRAIKKPVTGTVSVMIAGIPQTSHWAADITTGIISFAANISRSVAGVANTNPCVVTIASSHGLISGDSVHLSGLQGTTQLNNRRFVITRIDGSLFSLNGVNASGYGAWTASGSVNTIPQTGETITASFEFDVPVRFDTDHMAVSLQTYELQQWGQIPILEIRV